MLELRDLAYVIEAHANQARHNKNKTRHWDGKTPYYVHPIWCATMILQEPALPEQIRRDGSTALLYHDILEDTNVQLPDWLSGNVVSLIERMTFNSSEDEWENLWTRGEEALLLKAYDKTNNLLDGIWMTPARRAQHVAHLRKIIAEIRGKYENLNILRIAETQF